jgi:hypothetical protein
VGLLQCTANWTHQYPDHLDPCPYCYQEVSFPRTDSAATGTLALTQQDRKNIQHLAERYRKEGITEAAQYWSALSEKLSGEKKTRSWAELAEACDALIQGDHERAARILRLTDSNVSSSNAGDRKAVTPTTEPTPRVNRFNPNLPAPAQPGTSPAPSVPPSPPVRTNAPPLVMASRGIFVDPENHSGRTDTQAASVLSKPDRPVNDAKPKPGKFARAAAVTAFLASLAFTADATIADGRLHLAPLVDRAVTAITNRGGGADAESPSPEESPAVAEAADSVIIFQTCLVTEDPCSGRWESPELIVNPGSFVWGSIWYTNTTEEPQENVIVTAHLDDGLVLEPGRTLVAASSDAEWGDPQPDTITSEGLDIGTALPNERMQIVFQMRVEDSIDVEALGPNPALNITARAGDQEATTTLLVQADAAAENTE